MRTKGPTTATVTPPSLPLMWLTTEFLAFLPQGRSQGNDEPIMKKEFVDAHQALRLGAAQKNKTVISLAAGAVRQK